jgi:hypothetical protein
MGQRWPLRSSRAISACLLVVAPMSALRGRSPPVTRAARGCAAVVTGRPARPVSKASRPHYAMTEPPQPHAVDRGSCRRTGRRDVSGVAGDPGIHPDSPAGVLDGQ